MPLIFTSLTAILRRRVTTPPPVLQLEGVGAWLIGLVLVPPSITKFGGVILIIDPDLALL